MRKLSSDGFTIVELLIAMAFFSFLLLFVTFGFIQINRTYTKGITVKTIQDASRILVEDISREIRVSGGASPVQRDDNDQDGYRLCFPGVRYAWNQQKLDVPDSSYSPTTETINGEKYTIVKSNDNLACTAEMPTDTSEVILDDRAVILYLWVKPVASGSHKIELVVSTHDAVNHDNLDNYGQLASCRVGVGDQFCDVAKFETIATVRN